KNPDAMELLRGKAGRVIGDLQALLTVLKGLPLAYNKDMQEDKEPLLDAMATVRTSVGILPALLGAMTPRADRMAAALGDGFLLATDLADHLVDQGVPFREAHHVIGRAVALCLDRGCRLEDLSLADLRDLHAGFGDDALDRLNAAASLALRDLPGGPAPRRVLEAVGLARDQLGTLLKAVASDGPSALERALAEGQQLPTPVA
ncbi:MAG: hypothetical protein QF464_17545, partial [Myxococcota bacterium]|nr:hypothetical protein [Myxococcota bacterium]